MNSQISEKIVSFDSVFPVSSGDVSKIQTFQQKKILRITGGIIQKAFPLGSRRRFVATYGSRLILGSTITLLAIYLAWKILGSIGHFVLSHQEHNGINFKDIYWGAVLLLSLGFGCAFIFAICASAAESIDEKYNEWKKEQDEILKLQRMEKGVIESKAD